MSLISRRLLAGTLLVLAALTTLTIGSATAAPPRPQGFSLQPAPGSQTSARGGYFTLTTMPGATLTQVLHVQNRGTAAVTLQLRPVDATTTAMGGVTYTPSERRARNAGDWLHLQSASLTLAPLASADVPFDIVVPQAAGPGRHFGGIAVAATDPTTTTTSVPVRITTRQVMPVVVTLPGDLTPRLVIKGITTAARPDGAYLQLVVANVGGTLANGTGVLQLPETARHQEFSFAEIVPGTSMAYPIKWEGPATPGRHRAEIEIRYGTHTVRWKGTFDLTAQLRSQLQDRRSSAAITTPRRAGVANESTIIVVCLAVLVAVAAIGVFVRVSARRSSTPGKHSKPKAGRRLRTT
ncbi:MAG: putative protein of unknown function cell surface [Acidimicrobiales bacterium]|nr:putative protein of unknown function cell surface [Acidimicrobiales bacterium]